jgi:hypothetical protein
LAFLCFWAALFLFTQRGFPFTLRLAYPVRHLPFFDFALAADTATVAGAAGAGAVVTIVEGDAREAPIPATVVGGAIAIGTAVA